MSVNKVILIGHLGQDPQISGTANGPVVKVAKVSIATSSTWTDKNTGQKREKVEWHRVTAFNRLAEVFGQYLRKGSKVYIEGSLRTNEWEKDGIKRQTTEIVAKELKMLGDGGGQRSPRQAAESWKEAQRNVTHPGASKKASAPSPELDGYEEDIPWAEGR